MAIDSCAGELKHHEWVAPRLNTTADGSLYLSLNDMLAWDAGLRAQKVLKAESWTQVFSPVALNSGKPYPYGFGWGVGDIRWPARAAARRRLAGLPDAHRALP